MPKFPIAMTYGDAAAVPLPDLVPLRMPTSVTSLYGTTMPTAVKESVMTFMHRKAHMEAIPLTAQGSNDEEDSEPIVDRLEGSLDVRSGPHGFGGHHGDILRSTDRESCTPQSSKEAFEPA